MDQVHIYGQLELPCHLLRVIRAAIWGVPNEFRKGKLLLTLPSGSLPGLPPKPSQLPKFLLLLSMLKTNWKSTRISKPAGDDISNDFSLLSSNHRQQSLPPSIDIVETEQHNSWFLGNDVELPFPSPTKTNLQHPRSCPVSVSHGAGSRKFTVPRRNDPYHRPNGHKKYRPKRIIVYMTA